MADLGRRRMMQGLVAAGGAALLSRPAFAQTRPIAASTFPGAWEEAHRSILVPAFRKAANASVNLVASIPVDTLSKLMAAKGTAPFDVVILDEGPSLSVPQDEVFEKTPVD